jgi:hypothetical protein
VLCFAKHSHPTEPRIMPYIQISDRARVDPATSGDLERIFAESRIFGVAVYQDSNHALQSTITGGSAIVLYLDHKNRKAKKPEGRINRDGALAILKGFLDDGTLHPDYTWLNVDLPKAADPKWCRRSAILVLGAFVLVAICGWILTQTF